MSAQAENNSGWRLLRTQKVCKSSWAEYDARQLRRLNQQKKNADKTRKRRRRNAVQMSNSNSYNSVRNNYKGNNNDDRSRNKYKGILNNNKTVFNKTNIGSNPYVAITTTTITTNAIVNKQQPAFFLRIRIF